MTRESFDHFVIRQEGAVYWVWAEGEYPRNSVLSGLTRTARLECFDSLEEAIDAFPQACVQIAGAPPRRSTGTRLAPPWFDPIEAGETWGNEAA